MALNVAVTRYMPMACLHVKHVRNVEAPSGVLIAKFRALPEDFFYLRVIFPAATS
jgi:hypothetical protein